ncbi:hypothetical protein Enr13x_06200 [Stieleria neptunia]|uniref:Uncharacterized protein n=1 Tax=Stieleria neptunia TaxID=2527979 RepID=A0A518HIV2_9BACT|nr:hypothetical protein [Stieleria neptunia]QDV40784.1 hypothetical protein Enr13x_06200 [Stieleria neptunia]
MTDPPSWRSRAKALSQGRSAEKQTTKRAAKPATKPAEKPKGQPTPEPRPESSATDNVPAGWQTLDPTTAMELLSTKTAPQVHPADTDDSEDQAMPLPRGRRRFSWVEWTGLAAVGGLLIAAMLMYLQRPQTKHSAAENAAVSTEPPALDASTAPADANRSEAVESAGESAGESTGPATAKSIAQDVLADAGDGSFALQSAGGVAKSKKPVARQPEPTVDTAPGGEPAPSKPTKPFARSPRVPNPSTLVPIDRKPIEHAAEKPMRAPLPLPQRAPAFVSFERVYAVAFQKYQDYLQQKKSNPTSEDTEALLIECIVLFDQCLGRPADESTLEQRHQIASTLAVLYYDAGHLYAAGVYGLHVTRSADPTQPVARAAATLAFAAFQEAHQVHYTGADRSGDLHQLEHLCDLIASRGIKHPQLETMRFATGQFFERDGFHLKAAQTYLKIPKRSPLYAKAQLAAGREFWAEAVHRDHQGVKKQRAAIVSCAAKYLRSAIDQIDTKSEITAPVLAGMFSLAEISLMRDDPRQAISLLDGKQGVLELAKKVKLSKEFVTAAEESLFQAYSQSGDVEGIQSSIAALSKRYGAGGKERIASLQTKVARDFVDNLDPAQPLSAIEAEQLETLMRSILDPQRSPSTNVILWAAETWSDLATRASDPDVVMLCRRRADELLQRASASSELTAAEEMTLHLKRVDLAQQSGDAGQTLTLLSEILRQSPAAIDLQIKAAGVLTEDAKATGSADRFAEAIAGRGDDAIWGWAKLTHTLARMHFDSDDKTRYLDRLLLSGFQLNESRILQARSTTFPDERQRLLQMSKKHLRQLIATFAQSSEQWRRKLQSLQTMIEQSEP